MTLTSYSNKARQPNAPISISIICVLGFIGSLYALGQTLAYYPMISRSGSWISFLIVFLIFARVINLCGLWMMRRWAAYTWFVLFVLHQLSLVIAGTWKITSFISQAIATFFILLHTDRMK